MIEQLFITSIQEIILSPLYLLTTLKNKLKQTRHIFYFIFDFTRSHIYHLPLWLYTKTATGEATSPFSLFTVSCITVPHNSIGSRDTVHTRYR
jgi:hypothetical protein